MTPPKPHIDTINPWQKQYAKRAMGWPDWLDTITGTVTIHCGTRQKCNTIATTLRRATRHPARASSTWQIVQHHHYLTVTRHP